MTSLKIRVRNFQAIADGAITCEGFTVVTGRSNLGKTALIRAVGAMIYGLPGEYYVKEGEDWTGGAVVHDDPTKPLKIKWRKPLNDKKRPDLQPTLEINGTLHTKIGRDQKSLTAPHGISEIETSQNRLRPHLAMQHDAPFLVTESETVTAEVFKMLGRVDVVTSAQRMAKFDHTKTEETKTIRFKDRDAANDRLQQTKDVIQHRQRLDQLKQTIPTAQDRITRNQTLQGKIQHLIELEPTTIPTAPTIEPPTIKIQQKALLERLKTLAPHPILLVPELQLDQSRLTLRDKTVRLRLNQIDEKVNKDQMTEKQTLIQNLEKEKLAMEEELRVCPTCGKAFHGPH